MPQLRVDMNRTMTSTDWFPSTFDFRTAIVTNASLIFAETNSPHSLVCRGCLLNCSAEVTDSKLIPVGLMYSKLNAYYGGFSSFQLPGTIRPDLNFSAKKALDSPTFRATAVHFSDKWRSSRDGSDA